MTDLNDMEKDFLEAVNNGTLEQVKRLVDSVNVNVKGINGWSPLICAGHMGRVDVLQLLLDKEAVELNEKTDEGYSALIAATHEGHVEVMKMLLEAGAAVDQRNQNGQTALFFATRKSRIEAAELLLDYGANLQIQNNNGETPLDYSVSEEFKEHLCNYSPLNSLHNKLNASNRQVEELRKEVNMHKNLVLATCIGHITKES